MKQRGRRTEALDVALEPGPPASLVLARDTHVTTLQGLSEDPTDRFGGHRGVEETADGAAGGDGFGDVHDGIGADATDARGSRSAAATAAAAAAANSA